MSNENLDKEFEKLKSQAEKDQQKAEGTEKDIEKKINQSYREQVSSHPS